MYVLWMHIRISAQDHVTKVCNNDTTCTELTIITQKGLTIAQYISTWGAFTIQS